MIPLWIIFVAIVLIVFFVGLLIWGIHKALLLALNSVIGFFALYAVRLVIPSLVINVWSVLLTAILGLIGLVAVILLHFIGWAF